MSMNLTPDTDLISEDDLRAALGPNRIDAGSFEAGVRARIQTLDAERANDPLAGAPEILRVAAAAFLPLPVITGGKVAGLALPLAKASGISKLLGYVALPAISLFVLPAAAIFGAAKIRSVQRHNVPDIDDPQAMQEAVGLWWRRHKWLHVLTWAAMIALAWFGATWLMLLLYLISMGVLLYVLSSMAKLGLGNRQLIGRSCAMGLGLLGQVSAFCTVGVQDIHFVDQMLLPAIFFGGMLFLIPLLGPSETNRGLSSERQRRVAPFALSFLALLLVSIIAWFSYATWWQITPTRIKTHVEAIDRGPNWRFGWRDWEIVASWAIDSGLDPDLSGARRLVAEEISNEKDPWLLANAFRLGLVRIDQIDKLSGGVLGFKAMQSELLDDPHHRGMQLFFFNSQDWTISALAMRNDFRPVQRDYLAKRLYVTWESQATSLPHPILSLETVLRITQLLEVIGRPIDRDKYRSQVHDLLREFHSKTGGGFQLAGGFKTYRIPNSPGDLPATAYAVELMEIYGVPDNFDLNWVRSFLRPNFLRLGDPYTAAATLARLNSLPGVSPPTWLDYVYYERSLIMAVLLVGLCIYATLSSPVAKSDDSV